MNQLSEIARNAYMSDQESMFILSSPSDMAHRMGRWLHQQGFPIPAQVRMSRGYRVRAIAGGLEVILDFADDSKLPVRVA